MSLRRRRESRLSLLILLPPSEGKASGGDGPPLDLAALSFPALTPTRQRLVEGLTRFARRDPAGLRTALQLSPRQQAMVDADAALPTARTLPVMRRYTGVLFEALGYQDLHGAARRRASRALIVCSALYGAVRPTDRLPCYRLSATTVVPGMGPLSALWRPALEPELAAAGGLVVDLRSGTYAALARVPHAVQVRVLRQTEGRRTVVSHDNKHTKGRLARQLCQVGARTVADVAEAGRAVSDRVEMHDRSIDLVLFGPARQTVSG